MKSLIAGNFFSGMLLFGKEESFDFGKASSPKILIRLENSKIMQSNARILSAGLAAVVLFRMVWCMVEKQARFALKNFFLKDTLSTVESNIEWC